MAYLSKQLDGPVQGWPQCLKVLAGVALLLQESNKLTFSCPLNVYTSHALQSILQNKGHLWISNQWLFKYQALLIESPQVHLVISTRLNPATLLPIGKEPVVHDCLHVLESQYSCRADLRDQPIPDATFNWFMDGSSYILNGTRVSGYAVVDGTARWNYRTWNIGNWP